MNDFASQSSRWSSGQHPKETPLRSSPSNDRIGIASEQPPSHPQFMSSYTSSVSSALAGIEHQLVVLRQENDMLQQQVPHNSLLSQFINVFALLRLITFGSFHKASRCGGAKRKRTATSRCSCRSSCTPPSRRSHRALAQKKANCSGQRARVNRSLLTSCLSTETGDSHLLCDV